MSRGVRPSISHEDAKTRRKHLIFFVPSFLRGYFVEGGKTSRFGVCARKPRIPNRTLLLNRLQVSAVRNDLARHGVDFERHRLEARRVDLDPVMAAA